MPDITFEFSLISLLSLVLSIKNESRSAFTSSNVNVCCISGVEFTAISRLSGLISLARSVTLKSNHLSDECVRVELSENEAVTPVRSIFITISFVTLYISKALLAISLAAFITVMFAS